MAPANGDNTLSLIIKRGNITIFTLVLFSTALTHLAAFEIKTKFQNN